MPTPSSNRPDESLSFNSTCPDEQTPHVVAATSSASQPSVLTMSPSASSTVGTPAEQDDDTKPTETETETDVTTNNPTDSNSPPDHSNSRRTNAVSVDAWESYGARRQPENSSLRLLDAPSPVSVDGEKAEETYSEDCMWDDSSEACKGFDPMNMRLIPMTPLTYLRPGSRYFGSQESERQAYEVQVDIKHVDLRESFLCGYLRIKGLTQDHPTLTTFFDGEIIGSKYGFTTKHNEWGANDRVDMSHWAKFAPFHPFVRQAKKGNLVIKEYLQKENIFMRWKERFLVPDHRVRTLNGASFEGFYYVCFNQVEGAVHGIYFHSKSEKFQQLELKHVENRGCMSAVEFR